MRNLINDGLQLEVIFSLFLEFELDLHVEIGDLWPCFRIQVTVFSSLIALYINSIFAAIQQPKDTLAAAVDSFFSLYAFAYFI